MHRHTDKYLLLSTALLLGVCISILVSSGMGYMTIGVADILKVIAAQFTGDQTLLDSVESAIP
ncbi:MAG: hypothetical protein ACWGOX_04605, partial [Desulforhopalus sp.]